MDILNINSESIYCIGDIHGNFDGIVNLIKRYDLKDTTLIFCGDCGFGFNKAEYYKQIIGKIRRECKKRNVYCLFGRGNHDDPSYFNGKAYKKGNVLTMRDYTVINFYFIEDESQILPPNKTVLWIGGGTSIDRTVRLSQMQMYANDYMRYHQGVTLEEALSKVKQLYWKDEACIYDEKALNEITENGIKVEYVCTHVCPSFCKPIGYDSIKHWIGRDPDLITDLTNERGTMDKVYNFLRDNSHPIKAWYYGHYHFHSSQEYDGIKFYLLDMSHEIIFDFIEIL